LNIKHQQYQYVYYLTLLYYYDCVSNDIVWLKSFMAMY